MSPILGSTIVLSMVALLVYASIRTLIPSKKKGHNACCGSCACCPGCGSCHTGTNSSAK